MNPGSSGAVKRNWRGGWADVGDVWETEIRWPGAFIYIQLTYNAVYLSDDAEFCWLSLEETRIN